MLITSFQDYRECLGFWVQTNKHRSGYQNKLSQAAGCQPSYLSRVLRSNVQLTPDHAIGIASFVGLSSKETDYFLTLVDYERASKETLRRFLKKRLHALKIEIEDLGQSLKRTDLSDQEAKEYYYSVWYVSAIHVATSIPTLKGPKEISTYLGLPIKTIESTLSKLKEFELVDYANGRWSMSDKDLHTSKHSIFAKMHHLNWQSVAHQKFEHDRKDNLNFTSVFSLSQKDVATIRSILKETILNVDSCIQSSGEEVLVALNIDCFEL